MWTGRDDALLLLGVWRHGLGHWDLIAADPELKPLLGDKIRPAAEGGGRGKGERGDDGEAEGKEEAAGGGGGGVPKGAARAGRLASLRACSGGCLRVVLRDGKGSGCGNLGGRGGR